MAVDSKLLDLLCCPATGAALHPLNKQQLASLNARIGEGKVKTWGGNTVEKPLQAGLITDNNERIYRVEDDIPIMLIDEAIPGEALTKPAE